MNVKTKFTKLYLYPDSKGPCARCSTSRRGRYLFVSDDNEILCDTHAREKIEAMISQFNYQVSELRKLLDSFPKKVKNKSDDINIASHL